MKALKISKYRLLLGKVVVWIVDWLIDWLIRMIFTVLLFGNEEKKNSCEMNFCSASVTVNPDNGVILPSLFFDNNEKQGSNILDSILQNFCYFFFYYTFSLLIIIGCLLLEKNVFFQLLLLLVLSFCIFLYLFFRLLLLLFDFGFCTWTFQFHSFIHSLNVFCHSFTWKFCFRCSGVPLCLSS